MSFDKENIILNNNPNMSIIEYNDTHGFTPEILTEKKNVVVILQNSIINDRKETIFEYICKVQGLYYIYLTLSTIVNLDGQDAYKMRIYYDYKDRQQINLLLTSFKK
jgi:hypothetical protein